MILNSLLRPIAFLRKTHLWLVLVTIVLFMELASPVLADNLDNWHWRNPMPQGNSLNGVTYGNNTYVAVGGGGTILTSPDGITWTSRTSGTVQNLLSVTYGNNTFVAVGGDVGVGVNISTIVTSLDGITWTSRTSGTTAMLFGVTFGNNTFVAGGDWGAIVTSSNGITWTSRTSGTIQNLHSVTYGNNTFVVVGGWVNQNAILTSPDGITWTSQKSGTSNLNEVTYGNNTFVAVGTWGTIVTSPDGITWTSRSGTKQELYGVNFCNNTFVAVGGGYYNGRYFGTILTSPDGITWTSRTSGTTDYLYGVTNGNNIFVAVGDGGTILTSPDGITWTSRTSGSTDYLYGVTYCNNTYVAVGSGGTILTSPDSITWTSRTSGTVQNLLSVTYGNNTFVAVGDGGTILISSDGITWTSQTVDTTQELSGVTYGNNSFVAVGVLGTILTSPDGITWTGRTSGTTDWLLSVTYGNNTFVTVGDGSRILTSPDGITWTRQTAGTSDQLNEVTHGNNTFVAVGNGGTILTSPNSITWNNRASGTKDWLAGVTYGNNTFVAVGDGGAILTSPDGINWTNRTLSMTQRLYGVTNGNNTFVAVGAYGTIIQSNTLSQSQLTITTTSLVSGTVGSSYNTILLASGGTAPYTWNATGLPVGLSINSKTGVISGIPTAEGTDTVKITVTDSTGQNASTSLSLTITLSSDTTKPIITAPTSGSYNGTAASKNGTDYGLTVSWQSVAGVGSYTVGLRDLTNDPNATGAKIIDQSMNSSTTSHLIPEGSFAAGHKYRVYVAGVPNGGGTPAESTQDFYVLNKAPINVPDTDNKVLSMADIKACWGSVSGAKGYWVRLRDITTDSNNGPVKVDDDKVSTNTLSYTISSSKLEKGHDYRMAIGTKGDNGKYVWNERLFAISSVQDSKGPKVSKVSPISPVPVDSSIQVTFDEPINEKNLGALGAITIHNESGLPDLPNGGNATLKSSWKDSKTLIISREETTGSWSYGTKYKLTVPTSAVSDLAGNKLQKEYIDTFIVADIVSTSKATDIQASSAKLNGIILDNDKNYPIKDYGFHFGTSNKTENEHSLGDNISFGTSFSYVVPELKSNTTYYFKAYTVTSEGISYGQTLKFTTLKTESFTIVSVDPKDGSKNVPINKTITITFSDFLLSKNNFGITLKDSAGKGYPFDSTLLDNVIAIRPIENLPNNQQFIVTVPSGISGLHGGALAKPSTFKFNTAIKVAVQSPTNVKVTPSSKTQVKITWDPVPGVKQYNIYRVIIGESTVKLTAKTNSYNDKNLVPGIDYWYAVSAVKDNEEGPWSNSINIKFQQLDKPKNFKVTMGNTSVGLSWNQVPGAKGYYVYKVYKNSNNQTSSIVNYETTSATYNDADISPGEEFWYAIAAKDIVGEGKWSDSINVQVPITVDSTLPYHQIPNYPHFGSIKNPYYIERMSIVYNVNSPVTLDNYKEFEEDTEFEYTDKVYLSLLVGYFIKGKEKGKYEYNYTLMNSGLEKLDWKATSSYDLKGLTFDKYDALKPNLIDESNNEVVINNLIPGDTLTVTAKYGYGFFASSTTQSTFKIGPIEEEPIVTISQDQIEADQLLKELYYDLDDIVKRGRMGIKFCMSSGDQLLKMAPSTYGITNAKGLFMFMMNFGISERALLKSIENRNNEHVIPLVVEYHEWKYVGKTIFRVFKIINELPKF